LPAAGGVLTEDIVRVACVQLNSRDDKAANVRVATTFVKRAAGLGARLVALPETWNFKGGARGIAENAEDLEGGSTRIMAELAADLGVYLLAGSIYERTDTPGRFFNTSILFGPCGERLAVYRKIHLFDVTAGGVVYRESDTLIPGHELVTADIDAVTVGLTTCYDVRFPELYRALALRGARMFVVPSAFKAFTGAAHWEVLLRARAIENGAFVVAPNQVGAYLPGKENFGHSMVVDPWGRVLAELADGIGVCVADIEPSLVDEVRADIPSLDHRRPDVYDLG
jgi:predicted amidohydrolase